MSSMLLDDLAQRLSINYLALTGVLTGIIALITPWIVVASLSGLVSDDLIGVMVTYSEGSGGVLIATVLFLIGTILAVITPLSGIIQLIGIAIFFPACSNLVAYSYYLWPGAGPYLGIVSALFLLAAMIKPIGIRKGRVRLSLRQRIVTFHFAGRKNGSDI